MERAIDRGIDRAIERGIDRGIERGIDRAIERGIDRGIERAIERGIDRGIGGWAAEDPIAARHEPRALVTAREATTCRARDAA